MREATVALVLVDAGTGADPSILPHLQGLFLSTNAQTFTTPSYDSNAGAFSFQVGAPSRRLADTNPADDVDDGDLEADGDANDDGFFNFFVPDAFITNVWGKLAAS